MGALAVCALWTAACGPGSSRLASNALELSPAQTIRFPEGWLTAQGTVITSPSHFVFRAASKDTLLVQRQAPGIESRQNYAIEWLPDPTVRVSAATEWAAARPVTDLGEQRDLRSAEAQVDILGKNYSRAGSAWGSAVISSNHRWLALLSYKAQADARNPPNPMPSAGGSEPARGTLMVNLYDTATGKLVAAHTQTYSGFGPSLLFRQAVWIESRTFLMPTDILATECVVARF